MINGFKDDLEYIESEKGLKYDNNKRRFTLLDADFLNELIDVFELGSKKYSDFNWKKTVSEDNGKDRYINAIFRHLIAYSQGEILDHETSLSHLTHIAANCNILFWRDNNEL